MNFLPYNAESGTQFGTESKKPLFLTCVYTIVLEILYVIVSKEVFTNLKKIEGKTITTKSVKQGQTWLAATFEKWYTQTSVGLDFRVPCQHTGMVPPPKMCRNEHTKSAKRTHAQTHDQLRQASKTR